MVSTEGMQSFRSMYDLCRINLSGAHSAWKKPQKPRSSR
jgi:hypothetical protein